ncbi:transporter substrate-binding domain-containing protein [Pseudoalteromonas sp. SS15]|uniref:transporter substrate-binding domain-containing protein n=1 Tax=Pseudoalteromonas sp. SS15 TaxID=3139393 RepID=UPI003BACEA3F
MFKFLVIIFFLLLDFESVAKTVTFLKVDFAPYYILEGEEKGQGRDEAVINLLEQSLPEYKFKQVFIPSSRALFELQHSKQTTCMLSLYKTEQRKQQFYFSDQYSTIGLAPTIAMHKDVAEKVIPKGITTTSLKDLIFKNDLILGKSTERSYGQHVDKIILKIPKDDMIIRAGKDSLQSLTYMLLKKRVDLIIGYPGEHLYLQSKLKKESQFIQLQISESPKTVLGFIGCNKSKESQQFLTKVDMSFSTIKASSEYTSLMLRWVPVNLQHNLVNELNNQ